MEGGFRPPLATLLIPGKPLDSVSLIRGLAHATGDGFYTFADAVAKANHSDFLRLMQGDARRELGGAWEVGRRRPEGLRVFRDAVLW